MKDFFYAIQDIFVNYLFMPFDALRALELTNWFVANATFLDFLNYWFCCLCILDEKVKRL